MRLISTEFATEWLVLSVWMFMLLPSLRLESGAETEAEILSLVPRLLNEWEGIVYTDRPEWRYPLDAEAGSHAHRLAVEDRRPELRRLIAPQGSGIDERL